MVFDMPLTDIRHIEFLRYIMKRGSIKVFLWHVKSNIMKTRFNRHHSPLLMLGFIILGLSVLISFTACSSGDTQGNAETESSGNIMADAEEMEDDGKGYGPVKSVELGATVDAKMAEEGGKLFDAKCSACHKFTEDKYVGPGLKGITQRRKPEWIMNMIVNPQEMTQKDPTAKELLATYMTQMTNQNVTEADARNILEYFRQMDSSAN